MKLAVKLALSSSKRDLQMAADRIDELASTLRWQQRCLVAGDLNRGRITECCEYLEAAAGRLRCAVRIPERFEGHERD